MGKKRTIVVTRHPTFLEALRVLGIIKDGEYEVYPYLPIDADLSGTRLIASHLPVKFIARADEMVILEIDPPEGKKRHELTVEEIIEYTKRIVTVKIRVKDEIYVNEARGNILAALKE